MVTDERVDRRIQELPEAQAAALHHIRGVLHEVLPAAGEDIRYGMPCLVVAGKGVAGFDAFADHWSFLPMSGSVLDRVAGLPAWADRAKGSLRVPLDRRLTKALVRKLVRARLDEISDVTDGKRIEFYDDGTVKAQGPMKSGELHGNWTWFRADGTQMRTGRFAHGAQVGVWSTWDASGALVKETRF